MCFACKFAKIPGDIYADKIKMGKAATNYLPLMPCFKHIVRKLEENKQ